MKTMTFDQLVESEEATMKEYEQERLEIVYSSTMSAIEIAEEEIQYLNSQAVLFPENKLIPETIEKKKALLESLEATKTAIFKLSK